MKRLEEEEKIRIAKEKEPKFKIQHDPNQAGFKPKKSKKKVVVESNDSIQVQKEFVKQEPAKPVQKQAEKKQEEEKTATPVDANSKNPFVPKGKKYAVVSQAQEEFKKPKEKKERPQTSNQPKTKKYGGNTAYAAEGQAVVEETKKTETLEDIMKSQKAQDKKDKD